MCMQPIVFCTFPKTTMTSLFYRRRRKFHGKGITVKRPPRNCRRKEPGSATLRCCCVDLLLLLLCCCVLCWLVTVRGIGAAVGCVVWEQVQAILEQHYQDLVEIWLAKRTRTETLSRVFGRPKCEGQKVIVNPLLRPHHRLNLQPSGRNDTNLFLI